MIFRGIFHCHSNVSHDGDASVAQIAEVLRKRGFHFVAMTEHSEDLTPADYDQYVGLCREASEAGLIVIPGLEIRCEGGIEMAAVGVHTYIRAGDPLVVVEDIRRAGGFSAWLHPWKRRRDPLREASADAVEVFNAKSDGGVAPSPVLLREACRAGHERDGKRLIFGADMHSADEPSSAWLEMDIEQQSEQAVVASLKNGDFTNRTGMIEVAGRGQVRFHTFLKCRIWRTAYSVWNHSLSKSPPVFRRRLHWAMQRLVSHIKKGPA